MKSMGLVFLLMLLAVVSNSALAEWVKVYGNDKVVAFADPSTFHKRGNIVKISSLFDFRAGNVLSDGDSYLSVLRETEFNCKDHLQHMVGYAIYSGSMGKGKVLENGADPQDWKPVSQMNIAHAMWQFACAGDN